MLGCRAPEKVGLSTTTCHYDTTQLAVGGYSQGSRRTGDGNGGRALLVAVFFWITPTPPPSVARRHLGRGDGGAVVRLCGEACLVFGIVGFKGDGGLSCAKGVMAPNNLSQELSCASAGGCQVILCLE